MKFVLSIETSCDDTSVAILNENREVLCCLVASQDLQHQPFGGVVPEIASRNHTSHILPLVEKALGTAKIKPEQLLGIAVTNRPGLVGSLIVGLVTAKTLAIAYSVPFIGVHHIEGHIMAPFLKDESYSGPDFFNEPFLALAVSGGHTQLYHVKKFGDYKSLGHTIDDAAGEAFDKFAKMVGLPYPGGVQVDQWAKKGNSEAFDFPRPLMKEDHFNFSFSGLKSSAQRLIDKMTEQEIKENLADLCASYQKAIVDVLIYKIEKALDKYSLKRFVITGGVSANSSLRDRAEQLANKKSVELAIPPLRYCTDNAAMIGIVGLLRLKQGETSSQDLAPLPRAEI